MAIHVKHNNKSLFQVSMATLTLISQSPFLHKKQNLKILSSPKPSPKDFPCFKTQFHKLRPSNIATRNITVSATTTTTEKPWNRLPEDGGGLVEELRFVAIKLHTRQQTAEGETEAKAVVEQEIDKWEPKLDGYLKYFVNIKLVYDALEEIIDNAAFPGYGELRNTGLERSEKLAKDLEWFKEKGFAVGEPSSHGVSYAEYLKQLYEKDPQTLICHLYNLYFANTAGGRLIAKKVSEEILDNKELEFYKYDGDVSQLLQTFTDKMNKVAENWSRDDKNRCLEETETCFKFIRNIVQLILS